MSAGMQPLAERASAFLVRRRRESFLVTVVLIVLMATTVGDVLPERRGAAAITLVALALMAYSVVVVLLLLPRFARPEVRLLLAWGASVSPALFGMAASLAGSPSGVMWLGVVVSVSLIAWVAMTGARASHSVREPQGTPCERPDPV